MDEPAHRIAEPVDPWAVVAAERRVLADQLAALTPDQWSVPSLCAGWTVRHVVAHLTTPMNTGTLALAITVARHRGDVSRANTAVVDRLVHRSTGQLVDDLRRGAELRTAPPGLGPLAPMTDVLVHGKDVRLPLGLLDERPAAPWGEALRFVTSRRARVGFVTGRLPPLRLVATDTGTELMTTAAARAAKAGTGGDAGRADRVPVVEGTAADLVLAVMGRRARLGALGGSGAGVLRAWAHGEHRA